MNFKAVRMTTAAARKKSFVFWQLVNANATRPTTLRQSDVAFTRPRIQTSRQVVAFAPPPTPVSFVSYHLKFSATLILFCCVGVVFLMSTIRSSLNYEIIMSGRVNIDMQTKPS